MKNLPVLLEKNDEITEAETYEIEPITAKSYYDDAANDIKYLSFSEIIKLIDNTSQDIYRIIYRFLFETAARISEAQSIRFKDIDKKGNFRIITLKQKKNKGAKRFLKISDTLRADLLQYKNDNKLSDDDYIFAKKHGHRYISVQAITKMMIKDISNTFGEEYLDRAHPHTFRHSRAINLLDTGANIMQVKKILGHASIQNTMIYLKYSDGDLAKVFDDTNRQNYETNTL